MATRKAKAESDPKRNRQIVGFSLAPERAREVKTYAAEHGLSLRALFEEMWVSYQKHHPERRK